MLKGSVPKLLLQHACHRYPRNGWVPAGSLCRPLCPKPHGLGDGSLSHASRLVRGKKEALSCVCREVPGNRAFSLGENPARPHPRSGITFLLGLKPNFGAPARIAFVTKDGARWP